MHRLYDPIQGLSLSQRVVFSIAGLVLSQASGFIPIPGVDYGILLNVFPQGAFAAHSLALRQFDMRLSPYVNGMVIALLLV